MGKKISIIVPVYNVEKYLERCILSIVSQDISPDNYELILVNDGSTDNSGEILVKFQERYPHIQLINKENGGLSSARNAGLPYATGEYVFFIDSDDWLTGNSLNFLLDWLTAYPVDILLFGICEKYEDGNNKLLMGSLSPDNQVMDAGEYLVNYTVRSSAWQGLFARKFFTDYGYRFKDGFISEDDDFVVRIFSLADKIVCNRHVVYNYYQRPDSLSKGKASEEKIISDKLVMHTELDEYIQAFTGKVRQGLQRKMDFLAVDLIRLLIRKEHSSGTIHKTLDYMKQLGYFPLRNVSYSFKYMVFRILFSGYFTISLARYLKKYI